MERPDYDLIIVGGGLAGSSLAIALASRGAKILIVEQQDQFRDRIRGEVLMPWGSLEAKRLGVYDLLLEGCAIEAAYYSRFRSGAAPVVRDLLATTPAATCCMTFSHPAMQEVLLAHAEALGTEVRRGEAAAPLHLEGCQEFISAATPKVFPPALSFWQTVEIHGCARCSALRCGMIRSNL